MKKKPYQVLFEDEHLVIVNKESGILTIPDRYKPDLPNLYHLLLSEYEQVFIVHRLDKGTSGLICFAKTAAAHRLLNIQFEQRLPQKKYLTIVQGVPLEADGQIDAALSPKKEGGMRVDKKRGKASMTSYKTLEVFKHYALLEANIHTGRTHQIRVHMKHLGHPLAVDALYSNKSQLFLSEIKRKKFKLKKNAEERPILYRIPLHAYQLSFKHPISKQPIAFESPLPKDMRAVLNQLRKWNQ